MEGTCSLGRKEMVPNIRYVTSSQLQDVGFLGFGEFILNTAKELTKNFACEGSILIKV